MSVLLVSTYESGFQSLGTTVAAAHFEQAGVPVGLRDLSIEGAPEQGDLSDYDFVGFHVPMYHSLPQAFKSAKNIRAAGLPVKIFFFGLYAGLFRDEILEHYGDVVLNSDWEDHLVDMVKGGGHAGDGANGAAEASGESNGSANGSSNGSPFNVIDSERPAYSFKKQHKFLAPARQHLPDLGNYARLHDDGAYLLTGNVESTRGCIHPCTHCPLPPVYGGKITMIPKEVVLEDIDNLVRMGARHLCFIDPDFLNAPRHSLAIIEEMNARYPFMTYDFTAKISHFKRHAEWVRKLAPLGLKYVLTAMEFNDEKTLDKLKKKHSTTDLEWSVDFLRSLGVHVKPTFVFVNPWVDVDEMMDLLDFIERNDLIDCVDPVQYKIRLLLFRNSLLLDDAYVDPRSLGATNDFYTDWTHEDPRIEELYRDLVKVVDEHLEKGSPYRVAFDAVRATVSSYMPEPRWTNGGPALRSEALPGMVPGYDVPNFCCAEPTDEEMLELEGLL